MNLAPPQIGLLTLMLAFHHSYLVSDLHIRLCVQELLRDPVVAADGHTYERQHIFEWLQKSNTSPMTNEPMDHQHLIPNLALRAVMDAYFGSRTEVLQQ